MKPLLSIALLLCVASAPATELSALIESLPEVRLKALADTADLRAGNTPEMINGAVIVRDRLLPFIVTLESKLDERDEKETRVLIERDLEAISRDAHIRGHSAGWGGTVVSVETAWAVVDHLEARISWCVWQLTQDAAKFDFDAWHTRWVTDSEQNGPE